MPHPWGVSDPEQVEVAMPYDSEDGFPGFFQQGIQSGRLPLHGPVSLTCVKGGQVAAWYISVSATVSRVSAGIHMSNGLRYASMTFRPGKYL